MIGEVDDAVAPFRSDYAYNFAATGNLEGSFFIEAEEETVAISVQETLESAGLNSARTDVPSAFEYVQTTRGALQMEISLVLILAAFWVMMFDEALASKARWRITKLFGARPRELALRYSRRLAGISMGASAVGAALALIPVAVVAHEVVPSLLPLAIGILGFGAFTFLAGFLAYYFAVKRTGLMA